MCVKGSFLRALGGAILRTPAGEFVPVPARTKAQPLSIRLSLRYTMGLMEDVPLTPAALLELPIFPLGQLVLFPGTVVPLHIFEPRYRAMIAHCMAGHKALAIGHVPDPGDLNSDGHPRVSRIAGVGVIVAHDSLPDGRSNIVVQGKGRVLLDELPFVAPFRRARAVLQEDAAEHLDESDRKTLASIVTTFVREVKKQQPDFDFELPPGSTTSSWVDLSAHCLLFRSDVKQELLEEPVPAKRYQRVLEEISAQTHGLQGDDSHSGPN
jgi:Lon protease-like protein